MQVSITGNAGPAWIADINRNTNQQPTFFCRRHALIRITPCHRLSIERQKALQNNCRLYSDAAKGGEIYEAFYVTKSSPLYRWMPSLVLGKTLNCPATALSDISIFSIFLTQQVRKQFQKSGAKMKKQTFTIPNISCNHCVMTIKNQLSELEGVISVEGDAENKSIRVEWGDPATLEKIRNTLKQINYPAS
jgi:copper chaperone